MSVATAAPATGQKERIVTRKEKEGLVTLTCGLVSAMEFEDDLSLLGGDYFTKWTVIISFPGGRQAEYFEDVWIEDVKPCSNEEKTEWAFRLHDGRKFISDETIYVGDKKNLVKRMLKDLKAIQKEIHETRESWRKCVERWGP